MPPQTGQMSIDCIRMAKWMNEAVWNGEDGPFETFLSIPPSEKSEYCAQQWRKNLASLPQTIACYNPGEVLHSIVKQCETEDKWPFDTEDKKAKIAQDGDFQSNHPFATVSAGKDFLRKQPDFDEQFYGLYCKLCTTLLHAVFPEMCGTDLPPPMSPMTDLPDADYQTMVLEYFDGGRSPDEFVTEILEKRPLHICGSCSADKCKDGKQLQKCAGCKKQCYCSKKCQKKHWNFHKEKCPALRDGDGGDIAKDA